MSVRFSNTATSKTSSQKQKDLLIANHRSEELERQHESALQVSKQKQEIEFQKFQHEQQWFQSEKEHFD